MREENTILTLSGVSIADDHFVFEEVLARDLGSLRVLS